MYIVPKWMLHDFYSVSDQFWNIIDLNIDLSVINLNMSVAYS